MLAGNENTCVPPLALKLRSVTGAESNAIPVDVPISDLCGDFLARVLGNGRDAASGARCEVAHDSSGYHQTSLVCRVSRARCGEGLETLRSVTGAESR